ncbi:MAG TPA: hypothetical protein QF683_14145 [SAR324 cluster bacterium]|nr:hypothetical protein [SAR324 cluster bacterium]MDP7332871.1 hypothetical protein [SAR324 cluster bacterium]MDP7498052.1 hypothetical protein [SAR324 cluster bacterium]HJO45782.1 hypothetical protein [SAR324 cluster bacterium]
MSLELSLLFNVFKCPQREPPFFKGITGLEVKNPSALGTSKNEWPPLKSEECWKAGGATAVKHLGFVFTVVDKKLFLLDFDPTGLDRVIQRITHKPLLTRTSISGVRIGFQ